MAVDASIAQLSSLRLPKAGALRRDLPAPPKKRGKGYEDSFDTLTLVYDCFHDAAARQVVLVCPRLLNLWPILRDGLRIDGEPVGRSLRRTKRLRVEILRIPCHERPDSIEVDIGVERLAIPVRATEFAPFEGCNVLMAISKNNPIAWIEDWVRYHVSAHGADALLLIDNGSTKYSTEELLARLSPLPGLRTIRIVPAAFPYGGPSGGRFHAPAKFLQTSMFNVAQLRFLKRARAVLSVDIDELVSPQNGSIFDAAVKSGLGMISFFGHWVYPAKAGTAKPQRAHSMRADHKKIVNPKWCLVPDSIAGRFSWAIHRPGGPFYPLTIRRHRVFWHCHATSTSWKSDRTRQVPGLRPCPELTEALRDHLPDDSAA